MKHALIVGFVIALCGGCFDSPKPACGFLCGAGDICPDGYRCAQDGWCKRNDVAESFMCEAPEPPDAPDLPDPPDASTVDGMPQDATPDAAQDALDRDAAEVDGGDDDGGARLFSPAR